jgi:hypothetical protein
VLVVAPSAGRRQRTHPIIMARGQRRVGPISGQKVGLSWRLLQSASTPTRLCWRLPHASQRLDLTRGRGLAYSLHFVVIRPLPSTRYRRRLWRGSSKKPRTRRANRSGPTTMPMTPPQVEPYLLLTKMARIVTRTKVATRTNIRNGRSRLNWMKSLVNEVGRSFSSIRLTNSG